MEAHGLIHAYLLDGSGGGRQLDWGEARRWQPEQGLLWLHFDYTAPGVAAWIREGARLDPIAAEALLTEETRPRATAIGDAVLLALRGVNLAPGSEPEDMVAIRLWADRQRIITTRRRKLLSVADVLESLKVRRGPRTSGEFLVDLTDRLIARMEGTIGEIDDRVADAEERVVSAESRNLRAELSAIRREAILLRRYLAPQREAMTRLSGEKLSWLTDTDRLRLREITDRLIRHIEDLDAVRDRAAVTQEELVNRLSEQMNVRMYVLSLVAAIFLPLGFLTGLLGINLAGIPGAENPWAFGVFVGLLAVLVLLQLLLFRRRKWL